MDNPLLDKWEKFSDHQTCIKAKKNPWLGHLREDSTLYLHHGIWMLLTVFNVVLFYSSMLDLNHIVRNETSFLDDAPF